MLIEKVKVENSENSLVSCGGCYTPFHLSRSRSHLWCSQEWADVIRANYERLAVLGEHAMETGDAIANEIDPVSNYLRL